MADRRGSTQSSTKYQSTGLTNTSSHTPGIGHGGINGYTHSTNLAKPSVFDFNIKTNVCPTCQGTGRVPKNHDEELVAIIPYKDKRLKRPKRYCCYFSICLLLLMAVGAVSASLLFPRPVTIEQFKYSSGIWNVVNITTNGSTFSEEEDYALLKVTMQLKVHIRMTNANFVGVTVNNLNVSVIHDMTMVGSVTQSGMTLPLLSDTTNITDVTCLFKGTEALRVMKLCTLIPNQTSMLYFTFQVSSTYTYIAQTFETDYTTRAGIPCNLKNNTYTMS